MKTKSIVFEFTKTKKFGREIGKYSTVWHFYFFIVFRMNMTVLDALKKNRELGAREGQKINLN